MKKYHEISIIILIIILIALIIPGFNLTGKIIDKNHYSYTTAICNKTNYCEDYVVECNENSDPKLTATGLSIQQDKNWKDTRENVEDYCD